MALVVGDRPIRPLTADEVLHMVRAGILGEDERVELLQGVLTRMSPQDPPHAIVTQRLTRWLAPLLAAGAHDLRVQLPLRVPDPTSLPEPDIAVVVRDDSATEHPTTAALVIEVAVSSLRTDTGIKPALYAAAAVGEVWVVDVVHRRLEVFAPRRRTIDAPAQVAPAALDVEPLNLAALFAGLS